VTDLIIENVSDEIVKALEAIVNLEGISPEAKYRQILESALITLKKRSFAEALALIPTAEADENSK